MMMTKLVLNEDVDYSAAFNAAKTQIDRQNVVADFLRDLKAENPNLKIDSAIGNLQTQLLKQGSRYLNSLTNPGIQALIKFSDFNPNIQVNEHMYSDLMSLWGEKVINQNNMLAMSNVGKEDIIFVPAFYELDNYEQQKYLAQVFYWLNNRANAETLNLEKIFANNKLMNDFCNHLGCSPEALLKMFNVSRDEKGNYRGSDGKFVSKASIMNLTSPKKIADLFCFVNNKFDYKNSVRNPNNISNTIDWLDTVQSEVDTRNEDSIYGKAGTSKSRFSSLSKNDKIEFIVDAMRNMSLADTDINDIIIQVKGN